MGKKSEMSGLELRKAYASIHVFLVPDSTHVLDVLQHAFERVLIQTHSLVVFK